jgi:hypothetical protein
LTRTSYSTLTIKLISVGGHTRRLSRDVSLDNLHGGLDPLKGFLSKRMAIFVWMELLNQFSVELSEFAC